MSETSPGSNKCQKMLGSRKWKSAKCLNSKTMPETRPGLNKHVRNMSGLQKRTCQTQMSDTKQNASTMPAALRECYKHVPNKKTKQTEISGLQHKCQKNIRTSQTCQNNVWLARCDCSKTIKRVTTWICLVWKSPKYHK